VSALSIDVESCLHIVMVKIQDPMRDRFKDVGRICRCLPSLCLGRASPLVIQI
jgi:hypothetical protein